MPGSKLKKKIEKRLHALNLPEKVKVVEKPGPKFAQILKAKTKTAKKEACKDPKCLVGQNEKGGNCRTNERDIKCPLCAESHTKFECKLKDDKLQIPDPVAPTCDRIHTRAPLRFPQPLSPEVVF